MDEKFFLEAMAAVGLKMVYFDDDTKHHPLDRFGRCTKCGVNYRNCPGIYECPRCEADPEADEPSLERS